MKTRTTCTLAWSTLLSAFMLKSAFGQAGVPLWTNRFSAPFSPYSGANTLATDSLGHFYVTGYYGFSTNSSFATVKFTRDGVPLWTNLFRLAGYERNSADSIVLGSNSVFVTGYSTPTFSGRGKPLFTTIQYSTDGVALWTNHFESLCSISTNEYQVEGYTTTTIDDDNNVYVTSLVYGSASPPGTTNDFQIIKFSSVGLPLWTNRYDGFIHGDDRLVSAKILPSGHVVVTGTSTTVSNGSEIVTIAYVSSGTALWTNRFAGTGQAHASDLGVNEIGNTYVSGTISPGSFQSWDFVTLAYSETGTSLWTNYFGRKLGSADLGGLMAVKGGKVIVAGSSGTTLPVFAFDFAMVAYTYSGSLLWTNYYGSSGQSSDSRDDRPFGVAVDNAGNVYVTGWSSIPGQFSAQPDWATVGYAGDGTPLWTNWFGSSSSYGYDIPRQLTVDSEGNVVVVGTQQIPNTNAYASIIIKYAGASPSPVPLTIQQAGQDLVISWLDNRFVLQSAPAATGVFNIIAGATSPYTNQPSGSAQFFRLIAN